MLDQCLHDFVTVWHVGHHVCHVVFRCPYQRWPEDQSQVPGLHLGWGGKKSPRIIALSMFTSTLSLPSLQDTETTIPNPDVSLD